MLRIVLGNPDKAAAATRAGVGVLAMLVERRDAVKTLVDRGGLSELWVPALQAKDLALALEYHAREHDRDGCW